MTNTWWHEKDPTEKKNGVNSHCWVFCTADITPNLIQPFYENSSSSDYSSTVGSFLVLQLGWTPCDHVENWGELVKSLQLIEEITDTTTLKQMSNGLFKNYLELWLDSYLMMFIHRDIYINNLPLLFIYSKALLSLSPFLLHIQSSLFHIKSNSQEKTLFDSPCNFVLPTVTTETSFFSVFICV